MKKNVYENVRMCTCVRRAEIRPVKKIKCEIR